MHLIHECNYAGRARKIYSCQFPHIAFFDLFRPNEAFYNVLTGAYIDGLRGRQRNYYRYRLYRAQRLFVQLLAKSMLLAILIGNGIRFQGTIALCPEKGSFMSYFTRHKGCMSISSKSSEHKGCMSISGKSSEHKGCMSISGKSSEHKGCMSTFVL